jgi:hypothetical protein
MVDRNSQGLDLFRDVSAPSGAVLEPEVGEDLAQRRGGRDGGPQLLIGVHVARAD